MGVHGLTSFLRENRRDLSFTLELKGNATDTLSNGLSKEPLEVNIVVDGWSLIYTVFNHCGEPWVYGGENASLARHVGNVVSAWRRVSLRPTIVFDGPTPPLKYTTVISRLQNSCVKPANIFFRTSAAARSTPRSLVETRIAPPIGYPAIISTLLSMREDVQVKFAEGEADAYTVALAGRLGAYVTGNDSDFLVLNCEGYKGYIPLEEMMWIASVQEQTVYSPDSSSLGDGDDLEFQTVTRKKHKGKAKTKDSRVELGNGCLPPPSACQSDLSLLLTVYEPATLAKHVSLPPSLLPLLGALIGNDYASFEFFRSAESAIQRVQRVADTLSSVLKEAQSGNAKRIRKINRGGQGSVMDVIGTTIERLLLWRDPRDPPSGGHIDQIAEKVVQSTLEYAMDGPASLFPDEEGEGSQSSSSRGQDAAERVRKLYLDAYHRGTFHAKLIEVFARGTCFPRLFLEDPDRECCARSIGRPIRNIIWSVFSHGGGIPKRPNPMTESDEPVESDLVEDENELVDVVEELSDDEASGNDDDDPLAALRGKLQRLSFSAVGVEVPDAADLSRPETESHTPISYVEVAEQHTPCSKVVVEYLRRGARVTGEDLEVTDLNESLPAELKSLIPVQLRPVEDRLRVFLMMLGSDTHRIREIAAHESERKPLSVRGGKLLLVVVLRWVLKTLHARAEAVEGGSRRRERNKERWTRSEAQAFLASMTDEDEEREMPPIEDRAVQLTSQALAAFEACGWLAQALLLVDLPGDNGLPIVMGQAERMFSGRRFHAALARPRQGTVAGVPELWSAVEEGMGEMFGEEKGRKGKKERKDRNDAKVQHGTRELKTGMFGVFAILDEA